MDQQGWLVLCRTKEGAELRSSSAQLVPYRDEVADDAPGVKTGREVRATNCAAPLMLLAAPTLRVGKVVTADIKSDEILMGKVRARIGSTPPSKETGAPGGTTLDGLVILEDPDIAPDYKIRWAGDLDNDGGLDLVVRQRPELGTALYLFLSHNRPSNGRWLPSATTMYGGC